jgi:hypothetical protein
MTSTTNDPRPSFQQRSGHAHGRARGTARRRGWTLRFKPVESGCRTVVRQATRPLVTAQRGDSPRLGNARARQAGARTLDARTARNRAVFAHTHTPHKAPQQTICGRRNSRERRARNRRPRRVIVLLPDKLANCRCSGSCNESCLRLCDRTDSTPSTKGELYADTVLTDFRSRSMTPALLSVTDFAMAASSSSVALARPLEYEPVSPIRSLEKTWNCASRVAL